MMNGRRASRIKIVACLVVTVLAALCLADVVHAAMAPTGDAGCATRLCDFGAGCSTTGVLPLTLPLVALTTTTVTIGPIVPSVLPAAIGDLPPPHPPLLSVAARSPPLA